MKSPSRITLTTWTCLAACALLVGCGDSDQADVDSDLPEEILPELVISETPSSEAAEKSAGDDTAEKKPEEKEESEVFIAPYPDRVSLFRAPKRQGKAFASREGQRESDVELLGFVNVDGQRVILDIDGVVTPIAQGGVESGIEVISIQPPSVVLQRGRQRFQASLEN